MMAVRTSKHYNVELSNLICILIGPRFYQNMVLCKYKTLIERSLKQ